jgi:hypothetical protein
LIIERFGLLCLRQATVFPAYGRQASSVPKSEENKATGIIVHTHNILFFFLIFV